MTLAQLNPFILLAVVTIGFAGISLLAWRGLHLLNKKIDLLFKAAAVHARDLRTSSELAEKGFSDMRRADNHRRALLASLGSQLGQINAMLDETASVGITRRGRVRQLERALDDLEDDEENAPRLPIPGYRFAPRREVRQVARVETVQSVEQRKSKQIDAFFKRTTLNADAPFRELALPAGEEQQIRRAVNE